MNDGMQHALILILFSSTLGVSNATLDIKESLVPVEELEYIIVRGDAVLPPDPVVLYPIENAPLLEVLK